MLLAFTTAGYLTSSFFSGRLLQTVPIGMILSLSTAAAATALLGFSLTPFWPVMLALGFLAGLGGGAVDAGLNAYGASHFSARTLNWLHAFFGLGTTLGPLIVTSVLGAGLSWRYSYLLIGTAQALLAVVFYTTRSRWLHVDETVTEPPAHPARNTLARPVVWLGMLVFFVYTGVEVTTGQWSYSLLTLKRSVSETTAGLWIGLYWGALMVGRIVFGFIADHVPLRGALRLCLVGIVLGALLFWLEPTQTLALTGLMMIGFFSAPIFASLISLTPDRVGVGHADSAIGFQIAAAGLGAAALPGLVGVVGGVLGLEVVGAAILGFAGGLFILYEVLMRVPTGGVENVADLR